LSGGYIEGASQNQDHLDAGLTTADGVRLDLFGPVDFHDEAEVAKFGERNER